MVSKEKKGKVLVRLIKMLRVYIPNKSLKKATEISCFVSSTNQIS